MEKKLNKGGGVSIRNGTKGTNNLIVLGDYNLGKWFMPLPSGVSYQVDMPLCDISTNPPTDASGNGRTAIKSGLPTIQTSVVRPGKTYAGYCPGTPSQVSTGAWYWTYAAWNNITSKNYAIEAWINLPIINSVSGFKQQLCGAAGGGAYGPNFGIMTIGSDIYLTTDSAYANPICAGKIPLTVNTWHHIAVTYTQTGLVTTLYFNGMLVGRANTYEPLTLNTPTQYFLGGTHRDGNIYDNAFAGYISNFRLYT
jgi:hypothetical protein